MESSYVVGLDRVGRNMIGVCGFLLLSPSGSKLSFPFCAFLGRGDIVEGDESTWDFRVE